MSGRHDFRELTNSFTPERRKRVETRKAELRAAMPLHELRQARAMTQRALGEALHVNQPAVAKLERRTDMYISNLRAYIEAMGSRLNSSPIYHYQVKGRLPGSPWRRSGLFSRNCQ